MGAAHCRCQCEEGAGSGARSSSGALPPPGEDYNALTIGITGAAFRPESLDQSPSAQLYCSCEVSGKASIRCRTGVTSSTPSPSWRYENRLDGWDSSSDLLFGVYSKDEGSEDAIVATGILPYSSLVEGGFEGDLPLTMALGRSGKAVLHIYVQPEYVGADKAQAEPAVPREARVAVTFGRPEQSIPDEVTVDFTSAPLGMIFTANVMPLIVKYDPKEGQAKELGVCSGWVVMKIDGVDITKMGYAQAFDLFKERVKNLPKQP